MQHAFLNEDAYKYSDKEDELTEKLLLLENEEFTTREVRNKHNKTPWNADPSRDTSNSKTSNNLDNIMSDKCQWELCLHNVTLAIVTLFLYRKLYSPREEHADLQYATQWQPIQIHCLCYCSCYRCIIMPSYSRNITWINAPVIVPIKHLIDIDLVTLFFVTVFNNGILSKRRACWFSFCKKGQPIQLTLLLFLL